MDFRLSQEEEAAIRVPKRRRPSYRRTERLLYPVIAILLVISVVVVVVFSNPPQHSHEPGSQAPDFVLMSPDGESIHLADYRGGVVLLDFMDTDCHFCREETADVLVPLQEAYGNRIVFISVDVRFVGEDDTMLDIISFKAIYGATWTYVLDDGTVAPKYGVTATPMTFVLNADLTIRASFKGLTEYDTLSAALEEALGG